MNLPLYWVDAFTDKVFGGNPAAVVPLESWPEDALLQRIANENGLSETAFFVRTGGAAAQLRWFTPAVEVDLCGHATLAATHVLYRELGQKETPFTFQTKSGPLSVAAKGPLFELDFPSRPAMSVVAPDTLVMGLGVKPLEVLRSDRMWLCVFGTADEVETLSPDFEALATIVPGRFIPTAPGKDCDFVSRFFAPDAGIAEDPVTGSAHCTLAPYWARRLGKTEFHARQVSRRGGEIWCGLHGDRVRMAGNTVLYLSGSITV
jgi:predicted PhzF superfamily epimerase YddE/YHI9